MRGVRWAIYLWPGLPDLWWRGAWSGLALAGAFALVANLVVAATWVWSELLGPDVGQTLWAGFACGWLALLFVSWRTASRLEPVVQPHADDLFPVALAEYLRGNWLESEVLTRQLLERSPADIEAGLLLTAALRHTNRFDEARETLDALSLWDRAAAWQMEIEGEYKRLSEKQTRLEQQTKQKLPERPKEEPAAKKKERAREETGPNETEREMHVDQGPPESLPDLRRAA